MGTSAWTVLIGAVVLEVLGTTSLGLSQQFTRPVYVVAMAVCYALCFYLLSLALKTIPIGVAYAIWSGLGVVLIALIGIVLFRQRLDLAAVVGMTLIVVGVGVINLWSNASPH